MEIEVAGTALRLLAQRAAYLPAEGLLLVADLHLGKAQSFRRLGVPVPQGTTGETLARLDAAILASGARGVVFLGDLIHSARSQAPATWAAVSRWRACHPALELRLVRGNHDRQAGDPPPDWAIACVDEPLRVGGLALAHHPQPMVDAYVLAGHLHPTVTIGGRAHDSLRLPCFHIGAEVGVLPAFGAFTGGHPVRRRPGDRLYVIHDEGVRAVPDQAA